MILGKLLAAALVLIIACSSARGGFVSNGKASDGVLSAFARTSKLSFLRSFKGTHQSLSVGGITFRQTSYPACTNAARRALKAIDDCASCIADQSCAANTCDVADLENNQFLLCPVGGCCGRYIFGADDELTGVALDGVSWDGANLDSGGSVCAGTPCVVSDLSCDVYAVPAVDARTGSEVECEEKSGGSGGGSGGSSGGSGGSSGGSGGVSGGSGGSSGGSGVGGGRTSGEEEINPNSGETEKKGCFPADASVELEHGGFARMEDLAIGDSVKVGANQFSKVFMFTHKMVDVSVDLVVVRTASGASLSLTSGHYMYANDALVAAGSVKVGDELMLGDGRRSTVTSVSHEKGRGLYNPQTVSGDIVVNGVAASTYTMAVEPGFAHTVLAPLRALSRFGLTFTGLESGGESISGYVPGGESTII